MKEVTQLFDFNYRVNTLDTILKSISNDTTNQFYLLAFIHYSLIGLMTYSLSPFNNNNTIFIGAFIFLIIQFIVNIYDNGCFMLKLERKYLGKDWYGPYTIINYIKKDFINESNCAYVYIFLTGLGFLYGIYRFYGNIFCKNISI